MLLKITCENQDHPETSVKVLLTRTIAGEACDRVIDVTINLPPDHSQFSRVIYSQVEQKFQGWNIVRILH